MERANADKPLVREVRFRDLDIQIAQELGQPPSDTPQRLSGVYCPHEEGPCCNK
jgi:hypothetical protein